MHYPRNSKTSGVPISFHFYKPSLYAVTTPFFPSSWRSLPRKSRAFYNPIRLTPTIKTHTHTHAPAPLLHAYLFAIHNSRGGRYAAVVSSSSSSSLVTSRREDALVRDPKGQRCALAHVHTRVHHPHTHHRQKRRRPPPRVDSFTSR